MRTRRTILHRMGRASLIAVLFSTVALLVKDVDAKPRRRKSAARSRSVAHPWSITPERTGFGMKRDHRFRTWFELGFSTDSSTTLLTPTLGMVERYRAIDFELVLPTAASEGIGVSDGAGQPLSPSSIFTVGNPSIGANVLFERRGLGISLGLGVSVPIVQYDDITGTRTVTEGASEATRKRLATALGARRVRGLWDSHHYLPNTLGIFIPIRFESRLARRLAIGVDAAVGHLVDTNDGGSSGLFAQGAPYVGLHLHRVVKVGLRAPLVSVPTPEDRVFQFSLEPYLRLYPTRSFFVGARAVLPVHGEVPPVTEGPWAVLSSFGISL